MFRVIRLCCLQSRTGLSRSTIYSKLRQSATRPQDYDPTFPQPVKLGSRAVGWREDEVDAWLQAQAAKRVSL